MSSYSSFPRQLDTGSKIDVPERSARQSAIVLQCKAKVTNLCPKPRINQDILRLHVSVEDRWLGCMQKAKALSDIADNLKDDFSSSVQCLVAQEVISVDEMNDQNR